MRQLWYRLEGHVPVPCDSLVANELIADASARTVAKTVVRDADVSTVFLVLDHNHFMEGPPVLFETMVLGGVLDGDQQRYCTWEEAERGHAAMVARVEASP